MSKARILIVEDNEDNMTLVRDVLASRGYAIIEAVDGRQGLELAMTQRPDLIIMDLSLPLLDGWEVVRQLKADPDLRSIPVVALTAHAMVGDREKALDAGCDDYLAKPIRLAILIAKVKEFVG
jgi:two-component system, cell cycle response regulator DivK